MKKTFGLFNLVSLSVLAGGHPSANGLILGDLCSALAGIAEDRETEMYDLELKLLLNCLALRKFSRDSFRELSQIRVSS